MSEHDDLLLVGAPAIRRILDGRERDILGVVSRAYVDHHAGRSCLPQSVFVRFPGRVKERIIALPGYLGGDQEVAGIKWISSFPSNLERGISRASAILVLNSLETGRPTAVLESSLISAARTAASAAVAADVIHRKGSFGTIGIVGCGLINREVVRYLMALNRGLDAVTLFDLDKERARKLQADLEPLLGVNVPVSVAESVEQVLEHTDLTSFATTAVEPTVTDLSLCKPGATILHVSLRDIVADAILSSDNVVDDVDHVMRAQTSVHLAEQKAGHRNFVRCTLAEILNGTQPGRRNETGVTVFSPFGLGVLDLAVAQMVVKDASRLGVAEKVDDFFTGA